MKLLLIALILVCTLLSSALAEEDMPVARWDTPVVDGEDDPCWADAPVYTLRSGSTSADVRMLWDDNALYLLAEVTDPAPDASAADSYQQDSVEVFLDERCDRSTWYQSDDMHARIACTGARSIDSGSASRWYAVARRTDAGYTVEGAWQWAVIAPANGHVAGFDVQLNVCQNGRRIAAPCLHDTTGNAYQNTALFGKLRLEGRPEDAVSPAYPYALCIAMEDARAKDVSLYVNGDILNAPLAAAEAIAADPAATQAQLDAAAEAIAEALRALDDGSPYASPVSLTYRYQLPDLMTFEDGTPVVTADDWARRRAEIKGLYEYYMYGYLPDGSEETLTWEVSGSDLIITVARGGNTAKLIVPFLLPSGEAPEGGWPYYIEYSWWGTSDVVKYAASRGYAGFGYSPYAVAADDSSFTGAFYTLYPFGDHYRTQTGTLVAWTWGVSKIIDALEMGAGEALNINPAQSIVGGVSRFGKSVAVAGAFEERIMFVVPSCSGSGGLGMFRYSAAGKTYDISGLGGSSAWKNGTCETFSNIRSSSERHWFNKNFLLFADQLQLPFDQHMLAALTAAPDRHMIIVTGVVSEEWNNVEGQVMAFVGSQPAWDVLGAGGQNNMIIHLNGHAILQSDMELILDYADQVLYGREPARDLSVMKTNVFMQEGNASPLLKQLMGQ